MDAPEIARGHRGRVREVAKRAPQPLRYRVTMQKPASKLSKKLPLKRETIRSLAHLELEQVGAGAGGVVAVFDTGDTTCAPKSPAIAPRG